jgi:hypothetical protein
MDPRFREDDDWLRYDYLSASGGLLIVYGLSFKNPNPYFMPFTRE